MNKSELAAAVAERTESTPAQARRQVDAVLDSIMASVSAGERVSLLGFGTFTGTERPARTARNPRTGDAVEVPAAVVPRFRAGSGFRARVSGGDPTPAGNDASTSAATSTAEPRSTAEDPGKGKDKGKKKDRPMTSGKGAKGATADESPTKKKAKKKDKKNKKNKGKSKKKSKK